MPYKYSLHHNGEDMIIESENPLMVEEQVVIDKKRYRICSMVHDTFVDKQNKELNGIKKLTVYKTRISVTSV